MTTRLTTEIDLAIPLAASAIISLFGDAVPITPVPVRYIASRNGDDWHYAILAICTAEGAS